MAQVETAAWPAVRFGVIGDAWKLYKSAWGVWALTMLVAAVCDAAASGAASLVLHLAGQGMFGGIIHIHVGEPHISFPQYLVGVVIAGFFLGSMLKMALNQIRGRAPKVEDLFHIGDSWFDLLLGSLILGVIIPIAWAFFVIPGILLSGLLMLTLPLIVDAELPATGAMIQSWHVLKANWLPAAVFHFVIAAIAGLGAMFGGIGLLITGPLYALSLAVLYNDLFAQGASVSMKPTPDSFREW
jgi:hypothetical protein